MNYRTHIPGPPLDGLVERFWYYDGAVPPHTHEHVVPNGAMDLIISLRGAGITVYDRRAGRSISLGSAALCGARSGFAVLDTNGQAPSIGVQFRPGGAFPFLDFPAGELRDNVVALDLLWGTAAGELRERLLEAHTAERRFQILEQALLTRAKRPLELHPAVALALAEFRRAPHARSVIHVGQRTGLSHRWFVRRFSDEVGLTPKLFCRIRRLQRLLRIVQNGQRAEWAELALRGGYFDQAHMINDFRTFTGVSPRQYAAGSGAHSNHIPARDPRGHSNLRA